MNRPQRRHAAAAVVLALTLAALAILPWRTFDSRIDVMLPDNSELRGLFTFLSEIQVADKVVVTLAMRDGRAAPDILANAADQYLAALDPALATPLGLSLKTADIAADFKLLAQQTPDYFDAVDIAALDGATTVAAIDTTLSGLRLKVQKPEGMFAAATAAADPFGWTAQTVQKIIAATGSFGYRAIPVGNHLMDAGRRHLLLVLSTSIAIMDTGGVRRLLSHLDQLAASLPPGVEARVVCGHLHTAGNERVIRRDITVTSIFVSLVFVFLFLGVYRDWRAGFVVLVPFAASVPALAVAASLFSGFSLIVMGFGSVIAGIAIDYGIHTYVACRGRDAARTLRLLHLPVTLSMLTTLAVFVSFFFSTIPAYRQLGALASCAIVTALCYAFWALPHFVTRHEGAAIDAEPSAGVFAPGARRRRTALLTAILGFVLLLAAGQLVSSLRFDPDITRLDGTPRATLDEERRTAAIWGGGESLSAIVAIEADNADEALLLNDRLYAALLAQGLDRGAISSLAPLLPAPATRHARRAAWNEYWSDSRITALSNNLSLAAASLDFADNAFSPFWRLFAQWRAPQATALTPPSFLFPLAERFLHSRDGKSSVITFIPDEPHMVSLAAAAVRDIPRARIISRNSFSNALSGAFAAEARRLSLIAAALIAAVTIIAMRRPGMITLAAIPAITGLLWSGAAMQILGLTLNASNMIAGIMVLGLCIDYGICMVFAQQRGISREVFRAVTLSAITTIFGAAALLLARHPAFFSIGVTLVSGVTAGYLAAWLLLPALCALFPRLGAAPHAGEDSP